MKEDLECWPSHLSLVQFSRDPLHNCKEVIGSGSEGRSLQFLLSPHQRRCGPKGLLGVVHNISDGSQTYAKDCGFQDSFFLCKTCLLCRG